MLAMDFDVAAVSDVASARDRATVGAFDFLLCDLMMPDRESQKLFAWLRENKPELSVRTIFMTGGAFSPESQQFLRGIDNPCLTKPFSAEELAVAMARCRGAEST